MTDISLSAEFATLSPFKVYSSFKKLDKEGSHTKLSFLKVGTKCSVSTA